MSHRLGWIGIGRMGFPLAVRLLDNGWDVAVFNRTRSKAEPLAERGAKVVDAPTELGDRDIVFTMVGGPRDFEEVVLGSQGLLARDDAAPQVIVDSSTVSEDVSLRVRGEAAKRGTALLAAPVSGNPKVVKAGRLTFAVSGPHDAFAVARPYLEALGSGVTYVGEGEVARLVKICHNLFLGVVTQSLAEITVLAEKGGVPRSAFLDFLNNSVMGSTFTKYKTPSFVNLDLRPTFTPALLRKDFDLGMDVARALDVPLPVAALVRELIQAMMGKGHIDEDFAALLLVEAEAAGLSLEAEATEVSDGLSDGSNGDR
jgi:3-hydroxyisobutyrate dehydrogenase